MTSQRDSNIDVTVEGDRLSATITGRVTFHTPVGQFTTNRLEVVWQTGKPLTIMIHGAPVFDTDSGDYVWRKLNVEGDDLLKAVYRLALIPSEIATLHSTTEKIISSLSTQGEEAHVD